MSGLSPEDGMWSGITADTLCQRTMILAGECKYSAKEENHIQNDEYSPKYFLFQYKYTNVYLLASLLIIGTRPLF